MMKSFRVAALAASFVVGLALAPVAHAADNATAQRLTQRLFDAIRANDMAAVQASLSAGAHPDAADRWGVTPIDLAVDKGYYRIAQVLAAARQTHRAPSPAAPAAAELAKEPVAAKGTVRHGTMVPKTAAAGEAPVKAAAVTAPATVAWPAGVPNPFDPSMPPPRSQLLVAEPGEGTAVQ